MKNRDRETLEKELMKLSKAVGQNDYDISRDYIFLELLLDMRDELASIRHEQGRLKWASHL